MKYSTYIETNSDFQVSVNLEYDLNKKEKIMSYIPTEQSVAVLGEFLKSFYYTSDTQNRACVLIGPYGRGKSHLLLVLTALTSMDVSCISQQEKREVKKILKELCNKISSVNKEIGVLAKSIVDAKTRTLPVIVNSNTRDINQSFLMALNNSLASANLEGLLPKTYFDSAYEVIQKWDNELPEAYSTLKTELKKYKSTPEKICTGLKQFNEESYKTFCKVYPKIAAGMEFNPLVNMDVVKLYLSVVDALCEQTEYCGINIIFDEFSKFLESNLDKSQMYNLKIIQDLAEAATRSGKKQIHFTCITHKDILEYSSSDSFKTVEGRFSKLYFVSSSEQSYELITNAIIKKPGFDSFLKKYKKEMTEVIDSTSQANVFREITEDDFVNKVVNGCFPLAPITVYSLLKISELVGQNERTIFTFLTAKGKNTLSDFIHKETKTLKFVTIDMIYDYFEDLFKKEVFNGSVHSFWAKADSALRQLEDENQKKLVKSIAIINMIKDGNLKTIPVHIKAALLMDDSLFDSASNQLQKKHILTQRDSGELVMLTANGIDVQRNIANQVENKAIKINVCEELNNKCDLGFVIPHMHNDEKGIFRCFKKVFIYADSFCRYKNAQQILEDYSYDGVIFYIIDKTLDKKDDVISKVRSFKKNPHIIICYSSMEFCGEELLKKIIAAGQLREIAQVENDTHYVEEIECFLEDFQKQIDSMVEAMFAPSSENSAYYNCNGDLGINRQAVLNNKISNICNEVYNLTPVVNNEMVNKRVLNSQNKKGRDAVIAWLLSHSDDLKIPCMDGFGPEVSIFKSTIQFTGLDVSNESKDTGINAILDEIRQFVSECENIKGEFKTLYGKLISKPYGMRVGIIPIYISYVLRQYKDNIILYYLDKEVELSEKVLSSLNDNPESYCLLLETGTREKDEYLAKLSDIFSDFSDGQAGTNKVYSVMRNMQNWYRSLPEYTKRYSFYIEMGEEKNIPDYVNTIRSDLSKYDVNARELLLVNWINLLSDSDDYSECLEKIQECRTMLDNHITTFRKELSSVLVAMFAPGYKGRLPKAVQAWYKKLPENTKKHVFDSNTNALLSLASNVNTFDEYDFLDELVLSFESLAIEDWSDKTTNTFKDDISDVLRRIAEYREKKGEDISECSLSISMPGVCLEKNFVADEISPLGKTAFNNLSSVFDEYNDALEPDEKVAIIARLLEKIIQ